MLELKIIPLQTTELKKFDVKLGDVFIAQGIGENEADLIRKSTRLLFRSLNYLETDNQDYPMGGSVTRFDELRLEKPAGVDVASSSR